MTCRPLAAAIAGIAALAAAPAALAAPTAAPVQTSIKNAALHTCLDPSIHPDPYDTLAGGRCDGSPAQTFSLVPISGGPAHTYEIQEVTTGQCIDQFRFGIEPGGCDANPADAAAWTLVPTQGSASVYRIERASTISDPPYATCWNVTPRAQGEPGPLFGVHGCSGLSDAKFRLVAGL
jgi:hypothetical protein